VAGATPLFQQQRAVHAIGQAESAGPAALNARYVTGSCGRRRQFAGRSQVPAPRKTFLRLTDSIQIFYA
jgi:hypothetical protein